MTEQKPKVDLNLETGVLGWQDLARFFAKGVVVVVSEGLDLVDAAQKMSNDDTATVQRWLDSKVLARASDDDARDWAAREPEFWCIVAAPWVLVQECKPSPDQTLH